MKSFQTTETMDNRRGCAPKVPDYRIDGHELLKPQCSRFLYANTAITYFYNNVIIRADTASITPPYFGKKVRLVEASQVDQGKRTPTRYVYLRSLKLTPVCFLSTGHWKARDHAGERQNAENFSCRANGSWK
jgi:hypothetical protein